MHILETFI